VDPPIRPRRPAERRIAQSRVHCSPFGTKLTVLLLLAALILFALLFGIARGIA